MVVEPHFQFGPAHPPHLRTFHSNTKMVYLLAAIWLGLGWGKMSRYSTLWSQLIFKIIFFVEPTCYCLMTPPSASSQSLAPFCLAELQDSPSITRHQMFGLHDMLAQRRHTGRRKGSLIEECTHGSEPPAVVVAALSSQSEERTGQGSVDPCLGMSTGAYRGRQEIFFGIVYSAVTAEKRNCIIEEQTRTEKSPNW